MWTEVSSSVPHFLYMGSLHSPMICKCLLKVLCPVSRPVTTLVCVLLKDSSRAPITRSGPEINSRACLCVLQGLCRKVLPIPDEELRPMNSATAWFLWKGSYLSGVIVDCMLITAARRADCHSQVHHPFLNRCIRLHQRDATLTAEWTELWNRTIAPGNPPNMRSVPAGLSCLRLLFRELCYYPSDIYFPPPTGPGAPNYFHICDFLCKFCR
jgi:hypothetical protein